MSGAPRAKAHATEPAPPPRAPHPALRLLPWAVSGLGFVVYAWFAAPGLYWLDSQELGSAAVQLGVPHPTGFPLCCVLGRIFAWLPFGELAFRVHLASSFAAAIALGVAARFAVELARNDLTAAIGGVVTALLLGSAMTFFRQATVTEVYASTAAALVVGMYGLWRVALGAPASLGLGLALFAGAAATGLHGSFRLLLFLPFVGVYLVRLWRGARWPLMAPTLAVIGAFGAAAYLPLRSASGHVDALDWGHPRTAAAFEDHLAAGRIRRAFADKMLSPDRGVLSARLGDVARLTEGDVGALALLAAAGGAVALAAWRRRRAALAILATVALGDVAYAVLLNPMGILERQTGTPLLCALAILAGIGVVAAARLVGRLAPIAAGALAVVVLVYPLASGTTAKLAGRDSEAVRGWAEAALAASPPHAVALVREDSTLSALFWLTIAEPLRPDVAVLARQHLWDLERDRAVLARSGTRLAAKSPAAVLREILDGARPVSWELGDDALPAGVPIVTGVPMSWVGRGLPAGRKPPLPDVDRVFSGSAVGDEVAAGVAARAYNNLAVLVAEAHDFQRAAELAERSVALELDGLSLINAGRFRLALEQDALAARHLEAAARLVPGRSAVWALTGVLAARAGRCRQAKLYFERALRLDPEEQDAKINLGLLGSCVEGKRR